MTIAGNDRSPEKDILNRFLGESAKHHKHLCPRQVLGIRLALAGLRELNLIDEQYRPRFRNDGRRLLTIVETDGCGLDGVAVVTDCAVGKRTLRVVDYGKVATTLIDTHIYRAIRLAPSSNARSLALRLVPSAKSRWHAYLSAYQFISDHDLISITEVRLTSSLDEILSKPDAKAICHLCDEEIFNDREVISRDLTLCRNCAGEGYYYEY